MLIVSWLGSNKNKEKKRMAQRHDVRNKEKAGSCNNEKTPSPPATSARGGRTACYKQVSDILVMCTDSSILKPFLVVFFQFP